MISYGLLIGLLQMNILKEVLDSIKATFEELHKELHGELLLDINTILHVNVHRRFKSEVEGSYFEQDRFIECDSNT